MTSPKVLVVDDEPIMRDLVRSINNALGYETIEATNGLEGLQAFHEFRPDLVVSDVYMPKSDGVQLLSNIRTIDPAAKVILMTGHPQFQMKSVAHAPHPDGFLVKPFSVLALAEMMQEILKDLKSDLPSNSDPV